MSDPGTVNGQIIDSTTGVVTLLTGQSPSQAFGLLDAVMVETLGMAMHNAIGRQQGASVIGSAAVTAACAKMLSVPFPIAPPPAPKPPPPSVDPLPGPPPNPSPSAAVAAAFAEAESAVTALKLQASVASSLAQTAQARSHSDRHRRRRHHALDAATPEQLDRDRLCGRGERDRHAEGPGRDREWPGADRGERPQQADHRGRRHPACSSEDLTRPEPKTRRRETRRRDRHDPGRRNQHRPRPQDRLRS
ncbi:RebB family R body protein [Bradyrhizobium oligotrophicum S58]